jgi:hypothetical protein
MEISQYEVIINEKNSSCGFVVNLNFYKLEKFLKTELQYEVLPKEKKVKVFNETEEVWFINLTQELISYAFKTENLLILGGTDEGEGKIELFAEAVLV